MTYLCPARGAGHTGGGRDSEARVRALVAGGGLGAEGSCLSRFFLSIDDFTHIWIRIRVRNHLFACAENTLKLLKPKRDFTGSSDCKVRWEPGPRRGSMGRCPRRHRASSPFCSPPGFFVNVIPGRISPRGPKMTTSYCRGYMLPYLELVGIKHICPRILKKSGGTKSHAHPDPVTVARVMECAGDFA